MIITGKNNDILWVNISTEKMESFLGKRELVSFAVSQKTTVKPKDFEITSTICPREGRETTKTVLPDGNIVRYHEKWVTFDKKGNFRSLVEEIFYEMKNGLLHGRYTKKQHFVGTNPIFVEGTYKRGAKHGRFTMWVKDRVNAICVFSDGLLIEHFKAIDRFKPGPNKKKLWTIFSRNFEKSYEWHVTKIFTPKLTFVEEQMRLEESEEKVFARKRTYYKEKEAEEEELSDGDYIDRELVNMHFDYPEIEEQG